MDKHRVVAGDVYVTRNYVVGTPSSGNGVSVPFTREAQIVQSQGHPYREIGKGGDVGGSFFSQKLEIDGPVEPLRLRHGNFYDTTTRVYPTAEAQSATKVGAGAASYQALAASLSSVCPQPLTDDSVDAFGTTAISNVQPTSPVFDGATAVAELVSERKLFSVPGRSGSFSGEYLNVQLGAAPAEAAFRDFRKAAANSEKIIAEARRGSGKKIRRRYRFPTETTSTLTETNGYPMVDAPVTNYQWGPGSIRTHTTRTTEKWFSGAFTYYLPEGVGLERRLAELDRVYGIKPGYDTAWELLPFSFVADYFANIGDVVQNLNAFANDGLVMLYGYMMAKQTIHSTYTWVGPLQIDGAWTTHHVTYTSIRTTMQRRPAHPYGFGFKDSDLSLRQKSILAALAISSRR